MQQQTHIAAKSYALPMAMDALPRPEMPSATAHLPMAQKTIGEIVEGSVDVPRHIQDILAPLSEYKVEQLLDSLRRIEKISCNYDHEARALRDSGNAQYNFVGACARRGNNAGCAHQGIRQVNLAIKHYEVDKMYNADSDDLNNPIAKIQFALALVLAIGNHNAQARQLFHDLLKEASVTTSSDHEALSYYSDRANGKLVPADASGRMQQLKQLQNNTATRVLAICDKALAFLEDDVKRLSNPNFERKPSGMIDQRIEKIVGLRPQDPGVRAGVEAMLR